MRPYLAVLKDSFREALVSRVLWILMILATLVLAGIAPIGLAEQAAAWLQPRDLKKPQSLINRLRSEGVASAETPATRVWQRLSDGLQESLKTYPRPATTGRPAWAAVNDLREELNELLEDASFYDEGAFQGIELNDETRSLIKSHRPDAPPEEVARLNRLLLEAGFPDEIAPSKDTQLRFSYLGMKLGSPIPAQKQPIIKGALTGFVNLFVGVLGVFAGILVTASIVPQTFEAGAIDLLLSKPISRVLLFLTKFLGGCAFIFLIGLYFVGGLWLIVGLRFGLWSGQLLICIPVFMFLFAIYYSVSVLAGVLWKNAIISVVMTILFWGVCFAVGTSKVVIETVFLNPTRLVKIVPAGDRLLARNELGQTLAWDPDKANWTPAFMVSGDRGQRGAFGLTPTTLSPVYDAPGKRLLAIESATGPMGMGGSPKLMVGLSDNKQIEGPAAPDGALELWLDADGRACVAGSAGIFRLEGDPTEKQQKVSLLGFEIPLDDKGGRFVEIGPKLQLSPRAAAAVNPQSFELAIYDQPRILSYALQPTGRYKLRQQTELDLGKSALVAFGGSHVLLAGEEGRLQLLNAEDLKPVLEFRPFQTNAPRFAAASSDGRYFAVLFHNGKLWLYDREARCDLGPSIAGQGDISAVTIEGADRLLVADRLRRVTQYALGSLERGERWSGKLETLELVYRYAVRPLYTVFPKPGELDNLVSYLLSEEETVAPGFDSQNLSSARMKLNIWEPVWSSLAFLAAMLALGALYVHRKDF